MLQKLSSFFMARLYDRVMQRSEALCLGDWRRQLLQQATGQTLEIGAGTGVNLPYYPQDIALILSEPDRQMRKELEKKLANSSPTDLRLTDWNATAAQLPDASLDTLVSTLVYCSVDDLQLALKEAYRLLRPGGRLLFIEHVIADQPSTIRWQRRLEPLWRSCCGNCHLTRNPTAAMQQTGFLLEDCQEDALLGAPAVARRTLRGCARKPL